MNADRRIEASQMWIRRKMARVSLLRNEEVLRRRGEVRPMLGTIQIREMNGFTRSMRKDCLITNEIEGTTDRKRKRKS